MKTCIINTLIVIESLTIVNFLNKVQFPFVKIFPPQMLSSSSEGAVPIAFAPVLINLFNWQLQIYNIYLIRFEIITKFDYCSGTQKGRMSFKGITDKACDFLGMLISPTFIHSPFSFDYHLKSNQKNLNVNFKWGIQPQLRG